MLPVDALAAPACEPPLHAHSSGRVFECVQDGNSWNKLQFMKDILRLCGGYDDYVGLVCLETGLRNRPDR